MSRGPGLDGACMVDGCDAPKAARLGVCLDHWGRLPRELRDAWWQAWHDDGRVKVWTAARRAALEYLAGDGA